MKNSSIKYKLNQMNMKKVKEIIKKEAALSSRKLRSASEALNAIQWEDIDVSPWHVHFISAYGIEEDQVRILELLLTKALKPIFYFGDGTGKDEPVFYFNGQASFSIGVQLDHPFWNSEEAKGLSMQYFADNPIEFFELGKKKPVKPLVE